MIPNERVQPSVSGEPAIIWTFDSPQAMVLYASRLNASSKFDSSSKKVRSGAGGVGRLIPIILMCLFDETISTQTYSFWSYVLLDG